jgi:FMN phosphatase YigB (HAD superfamily)
LALFRPRRPGLLEYGTNAIGDSLEHDALSPARFGLHTVWFNEGGRQPSPPTPVRTITDLGRLPAILKDA